MKKQIPWLLIYLRFALTGVAVLFGYYHLIGWPYIVLLAVAAATDYYDGVLARKFGVETARLRQCDSIADTVFFLGVLAGMWIAFPVIFSTYSWGILSIILLEGVRYVYDLSKFKRSIFF